MYGDPNNYSGGTLHVSGDTFVQDRLLIRERVLELSGHISIFLSSNHAGCGGQSLRQPNLRVGVVLGF